jgi:addiction module HigA family antidote
MDDKPLVVKMRPPHPGHFVLDEVLDPLDLSITAAAAALGVRRASLSDLVNAKTRLSPEMALRLEKAFGVDMETLLRMQAWHDAVEMREKAETVEVERYRRTG